MGRYEKLFTALKNRSAGAFVPFVMIGDPNLEDSYKIIETLIAGGADALELGIPFSDPVADGPTIQKSHIRGRNSGANFNKCVEIIEKIRRNYPEIPLGLLVYCNVPFAVGIEEFYKTVAQVGADSVLIPDLPVRESAPFRQAAQRQGIQTVFIAPPNADDETLAAIAKASQGYVYLVSRAGVTGAESSAGTSHIAKAVKTLEENGAPPSLLGFGISEPEQVRQAISEGAAGAICGSAIVKIIESEGSVNQALLTRLKGFVKELKAATVQ
ncbi:tryptophan synthase subunit alpha [Actinomycetaceae bacterium TAE3-ERU4]|nr:tryptophan synthase subunit alpha [Actinomycetaceae bacterium TAE3-ERU4]